MNLRSYQQTGYQNVLDQLKEVDSTLVVMATGLGKTVLLSHVAKEFGWQGRVLLLAHREELIRQGAEKLSLITGEMPDIEMADEWADQETMYGSKSRYIVSSVQTQVSGFGGRGRMSRFSPDDFSLVIVDEAHHATADSYRRVLNHYRQNPKLKVLGVTATPDRSDEEALGQVFDSVAFVYEINDGITEGWLAPVVQRMVYVEGLDFSHVRTTAGDLNGADLASVMEFEKNLHGIAHPTFELAAGRKTLVFAASVAHAERLCEILNRHKSDCARFVFGTTDDVTRKNTLRAYKRGDFQFLVNVGVFTEGFDEPSIQVVAVARPTKSRSLYTQMVGRGTRPLDGIVDGLAEVSDRLAAIAGSAKPCVEVLDFVGNSGKHKLMTTADILGGNYSEEVVELAQQKARDAHKGVDMRKLLEEAEAEIERMRLEQEEARKSEAANRVKLVGRAKYATEIVNAFDVLDVKPAIERGWDKKHPATEKQVEFLRKQGINNASQLSRKHAGQLVGQIMQRWDAKACTFKQARVLKKYGYPTDVGFGEAKQLIDAIAANGWKRPETTPAALIGATEGEL